MQIDDFLVQPLANRRRFLGTAGFTAMLGTAATPGAEAGSNPNVFGPLPGYSPQIGILVSQMTWMRGAVLGATKGMTPKELDFLLDSKANRIGALMLHLAATEKLYQLNTFSNLGLNALYGDAGFKDWVTPMDLGEAAREAIKGHDLAYYLDRLHEGREKTLAEFKKRDDAWLMSVDKTFPWGPTNNLCKWFHVCEHESHHAGQISLLKSRVPGAKAENG